MTSLVANLEQKSVLYCTQENRKLPVVESEVLEELGGKPVLKRVGWDRSTTFNYSMTQQSIYTSDLRLSDRSLGKFSICSINSSQSIASAMSLRGTVKQYIFEITTAMSLESCKKLRALLQLLAEPNLQVNLTRVPHSNFLIREF